MSVLHALMLACSHASGSLFVLLHSRSRLLIVFLLVSRLSPCLIPNDYDISTSISNVLELRLQETRQLLLDSTSSDSPQTSTEAMQELEAIQTCGNRDQCQREWLRSLGETGEEGKDQTS